MSERDDMVAEIQGLRDRIIELERERDEALAKYETIFAACEEAGAKINMLMKQIAEIDKARNGPGDLSYRMTKIHVIFKNAK